MRARVLALATCGALIVGLLSAPAARADEPAVPPAAPAEAAGEPEAAAAAEAVVETEIAAATARLGARSNEVLFAHGRSKARDMRGVMKSLYRGKWFMPKKEKKRRCIVKRESRGNYRAVSAKGIYRGAYQMNRRLAVGTTYRMQREVAKEMGPRAAAEVKKLRKIPTQKWNRYWQDRAFWTIWRKGKGASHWHGGARRC